MTTTNLPPATEAASGLVAIRRLLERFDLDGDLRIGANDLLVVWRDASLNESDFASSVEHLAFYLRSPEAEGIKHPRAWMLRQLRNGYYAPPAGFVSWEEQQVEAKITAARTRATRLKARRRELFDAEFEAWQLDLSGEKKRELLRGTPFDGTSSGRGAQTVLRQAFARETDCEDVLELLDEPRVAAAG